jgi:two-component system sensor histidine kinase KdpD
MFTSGDRQSRGSPHTLSDFPLSGDDPADLLDTTDESLGRLSGLVVNHLDTIRLQAGALALALATQPIDVAVVISAAVTSLGPAASEVIIRVLDGASDHFPAETAVERS